MIEYIDIAGILIYLPEEKVDFLIRSLSPEKQRFSKIIANSIKQPDEIWQSWESDKTKKGQWQNVRSYLQYFDLSATNTNASYGVAVTRFIYTNRWELDGIDMEIGDENEITQKINQSIRSGRIEYSKNQH